MDDIDQLKSSALQQLQSVTDSTSLEAFRIEWLGKKGKLKQVLKSLGSVPVQKRREVGQLANKASKEVTEQFEQKKAELTGARTATQSIDWALPSMGFPAGSIHPITQILEQMKSIFFSMGFSSAYGPEIESDYYNFEALNTPWYHPARDMQDTFYITDKTLLRTHTSPVQIRVMQQQQPPIRCIMPGRVFRNEEISARSYCVFHQLEGLCIDTNVTFSDLRATLKGFTTRFFGEDAEIKVRPSYFPFTEPSVEVDVRCYLCKGSGCSVCKQTGWLEILGAGMVHPNVLKQGGIDPEIYTGFAFGMGIERIAMLKYGIDDIRLFYENDQRFLRQF